MMLDKCAILLLPLFITLPILEIHSNHEYDSHGECYNKLKKKEKYSMTSKMVEQPNYEEKNIQEVVEYCEDLNKKENTQKIVKDLEDDNILQTENDSDNYAIKISETMLRCNNGALFCENVQNYPEEFVNRILEKNSNLYAYAFEDTVTLNQKYDEEIKLCPSREDTIFPKSAESTNGKWLLIVQSEKMNFRQGFRVEICEELNLPCKLIDESLPDGLNSKCSQKNMTQTLIAIDMDNMKIVYSSFDIPASCCCILHSE